MVSLPKKAWLWIVGILLAFGLIRMPIESHLRKSMNEAGMLMPPIGPNATEQLYHSSLIATLGGMRTLVSTWFLFQSYKHFDNDDWDGNRKALVTVTYLEPDNESYWVDLVWHRGINAVAYLQFRSRLPQVEKDKLIEEYSLDAVELGHKGLEYFPDAIKLREQIAHVYKEKRKDYEGAAEMYRQMSEVPNCPMYSERFYAYNLYEIPERQQEAYDLLLDLYWESERNHLPTLRKMLIELQVKLNIPSPMWIPETDPDAMREAQAKMGILELPKYELPGGIKIH